MSVYKQYNQNLVWIFLNKKAYAEGLDDDQT